MGQTRLFQGNSLLSITERNGLACKEADGTQSGDLSVIGTYIHGMFDTPGITSLWLDQIGLGHVPVSAEQGPVERDIAYNRLAEHFETHVDVEAIFSALKTVKGGK